MKMRQEAKEVFPAKNDFQTYRNKVCRGGIEIEAESDR